MSRIVLSRYISTSIQTHMRDITLDELERLISSIDPCDEYSIVPMIKDYIRVRLDKDDYIAFDEWYELVKKSCVQLGVGYSLYYTDGLENQYSHMGISIETYDKDKQIEKITMVAYIKDIIIDLGDNISQHYPEI